MPELEVRQSSKVRKVSKLQRASLEFVLKSFGPSPKPIILCCGVESQEQHESYPNNRQNLPVSFCPFKLSLERHSPSLISIPDHQRSDYPEHEGDVGDEVASNNIQSSIDEADTLTVDTTLPMRV